jgi:hypothetical protein
MIFFPPALQPQSIQKVGHYDHATQQMVGYTLNVAGSSTRSDEDAGGSTTFWDGEKG